MTEFVARMTKPLELKGALRVTVAQPPHSYLAAGRHLAKGLQPLADAGPDCMPALALLAGQVAECALKAYLSRSGDYKRLKSPTLQHKLLALWALAQAEGLRVPSTPPPWLALLAKLHGPPFPLRYVEGHLILAFPPSQTLVVESIALLDSTESQL